MIWEYIKYEIRRFSISFTKQYAEDKQTKTNGIKIGMNLVRNLQNFSST